MFAAVLEFANNNKEITAGIITTLLTGLGSLILGFFAAKPKLHYSELQSAYLLPKDGEGKYSPVRTQTLFFTNAGRQTANNVEIIFNFRPYHLELSPPLPFVIRDNPDERLIIEVERLNPKESFNLYLLHLNNDMPHLVNVRFDGAQGKHIRVAPNRIFPRSINIIIGLSMLVGVFTLVYWGVRGALALLSWWAA